MYRTVVFLVVLLLSATITTGEDSAAGTRVTPSDALSTVIEQWLATLEGLEDGDSSFSYKVESPSKDLYVASIINETKTLDRHGLFRLRWDQRQVAEFTILAFEGRYLLSNVDGYVELKAPWGAWHTESEGVPALYSSIVPDVGYLPTNQ